MSRMSCGMKVRLQSSSTIVVMRRSAIVARHGTSRPAMRTVRRSASVAGYDGSAKAL